jgi:hypothetical protein
MTKLAEKLVTSTAVPGFGCGPIVTIPLSVKVPG